MKKNQNNVLIVYIFKELKLPKVHNKELCTFVYPIIEIKLQHVILVLPYHWSLKKFSSDC